jgi:glycyl-tRNA synthetase beta chain
MAGEYGRRGLGVAELLLEILSEEIPARMEALAAEDLKRLVTNGLKKAGLKYNNEQAFVTSRRLVLVVNGLVENIPDVYEERRGPRASAPDKAIAGFKGSLPKETEIEIRETKQGKFYFAQIEQKGSAVIDLLSVILFDALSNFTWPRSMRWADNKIRWVRPIRSIQCLFNGLIIPLSFGPLIAGNTTFGHRLHSPKSFKVKDFNDYREKLRKANVILDPLERRALIEDKATKLVKKSNLLLKDDPDLLNEVVGLVEWPVTYMGRIDEVFMCLPDEVLSTTMRKHQKYFSVTDANGKLAPYFIFVANTETSDLGKAVVAGNERVLRARLADAKFFWDQDLKERLSSRVQALGERVFHAKLGSVIEKVHRIEGLTSFLADICGADVADSKRAAHLAKADLSTGMVTEFPDLQGVMGRYYAIADGENIVVADAIAEHYSPQGPRISCPTAPVSVAVALADKIDTLVAFWSIDEKPTGSKDPYALRRTALGVIRLILENKLRLGLCEIFKLANEDVDAFDLLSFFADRLKVHLREEGVAHDYIDAVFSLGGEDDLVRLLKRVRALDAFLNTEDGSNLLVAYRRAANILKIEEKKDGQNYRNAPDGELLKQDEEKALFKDLINVTPIVDAAIADERFDDAMAHLSRLRSSVDSFFDVVTVNCKEVELRNNRLRLLSKIRSALDRVADFSKIEGGER